VKFKYRYLRDSSGPDREYFGVGGQSVIGHIKTIRFQIQG